MSQNLSIILSIIIPFYNVEKYIAQCLDSVVNQDIPLSDYEIICVNDASPDHSRDIVLDYMKRYPNIRLIEHEYNKKLGTARNTGRSIAQGKYIWNVDSDDQIAPNCLADMLAECEKNDLDILLFQSASFDGNAVLPANIINFSTEIISGLSLLRSSIANGLFSYFCPVWKQLYRKSFLDDNGLFSPEINFGEDVPFSYKSLILAQKVKFINSQNYYHFTNDFSLTGKKKVHSALELYEKSFINAHLIYDVAKIVPRSYSDVKKKLLSIASYTLQCANMFYSNMERTEIDKFRQLCKSDFLQDVGMVHALLSKRGLLKYIISLM